MAAGGFTIPRKSFFPAPVRRTPPNVLEEIRSLHVLYKSPQYDLSRTFRELIPFTFDHRHRQLYCGRNSRLEVKTLLSGPVGSGVPDDDSVSERSRSILNCFPPRNSFYTS